MSPFFDLKKYILWKYFEYARANILNFFLLSGKTHVYISLKNPQSEWFIGERENDQRGNLNTHTQTFFLGYLCWFAWTDLNPGKKYILRRLKSRIDWNLECVDLWIGEMMRVLNRINWKANKSGIQTNLEHANLELQMCISASFFNYKKTNSTRVGVFEMCWDDRINIVYLKLEILVFYSAFLCFYHVFPFGSCPRCTVSTCFIGRGWCVLKVFFIHFWTSITNSFFQFQVNLYLS